MAFYLGMDAGGSRTRIAVADDTRELARVEGESVKTLRVSEGDAEARFGALLSQLEAQSGVNLREIKRVCVGLSGVSVPAVCHFVANTLSHHVGGEVEIIGDQVIALDAAFHGGDGILVIAGTGSNVGGRFGEQMFGAGGWGPMLGDEGSGHWIGLEALKAALRARDISGEEFPVLREAMRVWGVESLGDLVAVAHRPGTRFAALAPVVVACAAQGDAIAGEVLDRAGEELAVQVVAVCSKMRLAGFRAERCGVAYTGSVLEKIERVRQRFTEVLTTRVMGGLFVVGAVDPVDGALWRARSLASNPA